MAIGLVQRLEPPEVNVLRAGVIAVWGLLLLAIGWIGVRVNAHTRFGAAERAAYMESGLISGVRRRA